MDLTRSHASFTSTSLTLIEALADEKTSDAAVAELTRIYWPAVYSFLRKNGYDREHASELTQAFFVHKVYEGDFFGGFDKERGRLRSLILRSVKNFTIDSHRRADRTQQVMIQKYQLSPQDESWLPSDTAECVFDRRWAIAQLTESLQRCEEYFHESGRENHWHIFSARVLQPTMYCSAPPPLNQLATELGFKDAACAAAAVQLVKRRISVFLREIVNDSVPNPIEAQSELDSILSILKM